MKSLSQALFIGFAILALAGCNLDGDPVMTTVSFNLTDAPIDPTTIKNVFVSFSGLSINQSATAAESDSSWISVSIDSTHEYDLLSLTEGVSALLGNIPIEAGTQVNQIRFLNPTIEIVETANPATRLPCTLSSSTGLKIVNAFDVPLSGALSLTVDFDVRKSLVFITGTGAGTGYRMKPVLRAVVDGEAGSIGGTAPAGFAVYAYKDGTYDSVAGDPANSADSPEFDDAYSSAIIKDTDSDGTFSYTLAFLEAGIYDLVVVDVNSADGTTPTFVVADIAVTSGHKTISNIALP